MMIPSEPVGNIPRIPKLVEALSKAGGTNPNPDHLFALFCDDSSTLRGAVFAKIQARVSDTARAAEIVGARW